MKNPAVWCELRDFLFVTFVDTATLNKKLWFGNNLRGTYSDNFDLKKENPYL